MHGETGIVVYLFTTIHNLRTKNNVQNMLINIV